MTLWSANTLLLGSRRNTTAASPARDKNAVMGGSRTAGGCTGTSSARLAAPALGRLQLEHEWLGAPSPRRHAGSRPLTRAARSSQGVHAAQLGAAAEPGMEAPAPRLPFHSPPREQGRSDSSARPLFPNSILDFVHGKDRSGSQKFNFLRPPQLAAARVEFNAVSQAVPGWLCRSAS